MLHFTLLSGLSRLTAALTVLIHIQVEDAAPLIFRDVLYVGPLVLIGAEPGFRVGSLFRLSLPLTLTLALTFLGVRGWKR